MVIRLIKILLFASLVLFRTAAAEETLLSLERAIDIALGGSHTVRSYREQKKSMEHYFRYYQAMFDPRLDLDVFAPSWDESVSGIQRVDGLPVYNSIGSLRYSSRLKFTYPLPTGGNLALSSEFYRTNEKTVLALQDYETLSSRKAQSSFSLSFEQPVFTRNTLDENRNEARLRYDKASSLFTRKQMDIIYQVTKSFFQVYRSTREVEISSEKLVNSEETFRVARLKLEAGRIPEGDVLISEVAVAENRAALSEKEGNLERAKDELKQLIGLSLFEPVRVVADLRYDTLRVVEQQAIDKALANRLELREAQLDRELRDIELDRAKRIRAVSGNISAYYDITGVSTREHGSTADLFNSSMRNFADRPPNRGITFSVNCPIFDWGRGRERVQQQMANLRNAELTIENQRNDIIREVRDIVRRVEEAGSRLGIHEQNQKLAERSYGISRLRFESGAITSQDLALAQERLAVSQLNYLDAYISYQLAVAELRQQTLWDFEANRKYEVEDRYSDTGSSK